MLVAEVHRRQQECHNLGLGFSTPYLFRNPTPSLLSRADHHPLRRDGVPRRLRRKGAGVEAPQGGVPLPPSVTAEDPSVSQLGHGYGSATTESRNKSRNTWLGSTPTSQGGHGRSTRTVL